MTTLACDYAWQHPNPAAIKAAGYVGVLRYLSTDPTKNLSAAERDALFAAGLGINLAWETTATRATQGYTAGVEDGRAALAQAQALGYPALVPIYFAVDENVNWAEVAPYFRGVQSVVGHQTGIYGSAAIVEGAVGSGVAWSWQCEAWSGTVVSPVAHLYQRVTPTLTIQGAQGEYDEDVVLTPNYPWWASSTPAPAPTPPSYQETSMRSIPVQVEILGGEGWCACPVPAAKVVSVTVQDQNPADVGHYPTVPSFAGVATQSGPNAPNGALVFHGGANGVYGVNVWAVT